MESQTCVLLGVKVKPGPIERHVIENFALDNTVDRLKNEAEKKLNIPSASLELIFRGKILKDSATLQNSGVKSGEMIHLVKKKVQPPPTPPPTYTDAELQHIATSLRTLGCTPNAPGWTRAMQLLNDESAMAEILEQAPSLNDDCVTLSILHEVELLAALGTNVQTMRRAANIRPDLPIALRHLLRLVHSRGNTISTNSNVPTSGFAYSLEALSEDEDGEDDDNDDGETNTIRQEQLALALRRMSEAVQSRRSGSTGHGSLLRLLAGDSRSGVANPAQQGTSSGSTTSNPPMLITSEMLSNAMTEAMNQSTSRVEATPPAGGTRSASASTPLVITPEMFRNAMTDAMGNITSDIVNQATRDAAVAATNEAVSRATDSAEATPMEQSTTASSSDNLAAVHDEIPAQLVHMREMGLVDDELNVRALLMCHGDVNAAINLVFSGVINDD